MNEKEPDREVLARQFTDALNRRGYSFQYAAVNAASDLCQAGESRLIFEATELAGCSSRLVTHIDILLRAGHRDVYLAGECNGETKGRTELTKDGDESRAAYAPIP
jgi:hypothetical protein